MKKLILLIFSLLMLSMFFVISASAEDTVYVATVDTTPALHLSPREDSYIVTDVPGCAELRLIETKGTWGLVVFANKCGWINLSFTRDTYEDAAEATGYDSPKNVETISKNNKIGLYTLPSDKAKHGSEKKYTVPNGMVLKLKRETYDGWGLVSMGEEFAWVKLEFTKPYLTEAEQAISDYELYYVYTLSKNGEGVKIYSDYKGTNAIATVADCVKLTVRETKENYAYVSYNGAGGWVNLDETTRSFSNAQISAGEPVYDEFEITEETLTGSVDIYNVPSDKVKDGAGVIGSVDAGTRVFVQRRTADGWMLINYEGNVGWIPGGSVIKAENDSSVAVIAPLKEKKEGYVATGGEDGLDIYPSYDEDSVVAHIPECVKVTILAEFGGMQYAYCDYASGWIKPGGIAESYEKALNTNNGGKILNYKTIKSTDIMSLPIQGNLCGNKKIATVKENTNLIVVRTVITGNTQWGLVTVDGKTGWINLSKTSRVYSAKEITLICLFSVVLIVVLAFVMRLIVRKIKKRKKSEAEENSEESKKEESEKETESVESE